MNKKYEFTGETKVVFGVVLKRIRALINFGIVKKGDLGGWIKGEENLSHEGDAWVYSNANVYGSAKVYGNAKVFDNANVSGSAKVYGNSKVCDDACVFDNAKVYGNAEVCGDAWVYSNAEVFDNANVYGSAKVYGNAEVCGDAWVYSNAEVCGDAYINSMGQLIVVGSIGRRSGFTSFFLNRKKEIKIRCGCFFGNSEEFLTRVKSTHGDNNHAKSYRLALQLAQSVLDTSGGER